jgi:hypothetical protein
MRLSANSPWGLFCDLAPLRDKPWAAWWTIPTTAMVKQTLSTSLWLLAVCVRPVKPCTTRLDSRSPKSDLTPLPLSENYASYHQEGQSDWTPLSTGLFSFPKRKRRNTVDTNAALGRAFTARRKASTPCCCLCGNQPSAPTGHCRHRWQRAGATRLAPVFSDGTETINDTVRGLREQSGSQTAVLLLAGHEAIHFVDDGRWL